MFLLVVSLYHTKLTTIFDSHFTIAFSYICLTLDKEGLLSVILLLTCLLFVLTNIKNNLFIMIVDT